MDKELYFHEITGCWHVLGHFETSLVELGDFEQLISATVYTTLVDNADLHSTGLLGLVQPSSLVLVWTMDDDNFLSELHDAGNHDTAEFSV